MSLTVEMHKRLGDFVLDVRFETDGGVLGLLGASGCGKSMTLKCIAGIERPDSGRIVLDGVTLFDSQRGINLPPQQRGVGYLFQYYALFPNMTVRQNILCGMRGKGDRQTRERRLNEMLSLLHLEEVAGHRPHQLSGGQAQRTALARILVNEPKLLMLDEPFSALDSHLRDQLQWQLRGLLASFGRDVLMVTHSRDEAYHLCGRIAVMEDGQMRALKETKALFADPGSVCAARLTGCKNIVPAQKAGEYAVRVPGWGGRADNSAARARRLVRHRHPRALFQQPRAAEPLSGGIRLGHGGAVRVDRGLPLCRAARGRAERVVARAQGSQTHALPGRAWHCAGEYPAAVQMTSEKTDRQSECTAGLFWFSEPAFRRHIRRRSEFGAAIWGRSQTGRCQAR